MKKKKEKIVIGVFETVRVICSRGKEVEVMVKVDTGAKSSSIDGELARSLGLMTEDRIVREKRYRSSLGRENRPILKIVFWFRGRKIEGRVSVTDRSGMRKKMIIGRRDLDGFLVDSGKFKQRDYQGRRVDRK